MEQTVDPQVAEHEPPGGQVHARAGQPGDPTDDAPVDGRTRRALRTRDAVVDALLALQEEGDLAPTAQRVAARAGVALRTVYGHFSDMEALWLEAGRRELEKISALADVPDPALPLAERLPRFCASRARVLEALLPVMRATRLRLPGSAQLRRNWSWYVKVGDKELRAVFATEFDRLDDDEAAALLDGLYCVCSAAAWDALRVDRGLDPEAAAAVVVTGVTALLGGGR
ncbi:MAG: TetR family transcriptional regulator [Frankiales bacterium]|nr:TetR family transcriptional regulator [Frankiales bacterium]